MADISVTATSVLTTDAAAETEFGTLGATVTAGQALYKDTAFKSGMVLTVRRRCAAAAVAACAAEFIENGEREHDTEC